MFIEPVPTRNADILLSVIKRRIARGTTIISDCWKAYNCLSSAGYKHLTVNHTYNFVDQESGAHTQHIERLWRDLRGGTPKYGRRKKYWSSYIATFLFKRKYRYDERIESYFQAMSEMYPIAEDDFTPGSPSS